YTPVKYAWYFGDGDSATGPTASHYYNNTVASTNLDVKLVVTSEDPYGDFCTDSVTKTIQINTIPTVNIFSDPNSPGCVSDTVQFYGFSNQKIASWYWDFNDGGSSNLQNPLHHFAHTGTYNVALYVTDSSGCSNSATYPYTVQSPTVSIGVSSNPAGTLDTLQFSGSSSVNVLTWNWTFGDGAIASVQNPTHLYSSKGNYLVTLSVLTDNLCMPSVTDTVSIETLPYSNFTFSGHCLGSPTTFTDESYSTPSNIKKWVWVFGDGDSTVLAVSNVNVLHPVVTHTYKNPGVYAVTLTVTNVSYSRSKTKNVVIVPKPTVNFSYIQTCFYDTTVFRGQTSDTTQDYWKWNFGDGYASTAKDTLHKYLNPGTYPVKLVVKNIYGCSDSATKSVVIDTLPTVSISMAKSKLCLGENEQLYGNSQDTVTWHWNLGNGDTSTYQNPLPYSYSTTGTYLVTLKVTDKNSCSSTVSDSVVVMDNPKVDFNYGPQLCKTDSVRFIDKTTTTSGILTSFAWNFGDTASTANQSVQENPKHYFSGGAGSYKVQLLATNSYGCKDSTYKYVKVYDTPKAGFTYKQLTSPMTKVEFTDTSKQSQNLSPIKSY
ncbi:MAG: PKD domain-containing protein, partial [Bacteroidales bacterium]|nr:PKD domain-containing protein [Bacteroidales bacterium]